MRVYIVTDLEGVSGITLWRQTGPADSEAYQAARRLLMGDINAAVQGCLDGGATHVAVLDGHGHPLNVIPEEMHPGAEYICGSGMPIGWGMDETYDCGMQVGCHAMNRTPDGVLYHTQSHATDARYWYNDRECGEIAQGALVMGHFGIPMLMVTGDEAACREAREFFGDHVVTVAVKKGFGRQSCRMVAPEKARQMIRAGAQEAMGRIALCRPFTMELPIRARVEALVTPALDSATPAEIEAAPHQSYEGVCQTALGIYSF